MCVCVAYAYREKLYTPRHTVLSAAPIIFPPFTVPSWLSPRPRPPPPPVLTRLDFRMCLRTTSGSGRTSRNNDAPGTAAAGLPRPCRIDLTVYTRAGVLSFNARQVRFSALRAFPRLRRIYRFLSPPDIAYRAHDVGPINDPTPLRFVYM